MLLLGSIYRHDLSQLLIDQFSLDNKLLFMAKKIRRVSSLPLPPSAASYPSSKLLPLSVSGQSENPEDQFSATSSAEKLEDDIKSEDQPSSSSNNQDADQQKEIMVRTVFMLRQDRHEAPPRPLPHKIDRTRKQMQIRREAKN